MEINKNLCNKEENGFELTVIKSILEISKSNFFKQKSIDLYGKVVVCLVLVNLSSSAAATNKPLSNIQAEVSECRKFKPSV